MNQTSLPQLHGISLKKIYGQHFLQDSYYLDIMISHVHIEKQSSLLEIGCGAGALTQRLLSMDTERVWVYEIDEEWATYVQRTYSQDQRLRIIVDDVLQRDMEELAPYAPWIVLANIPYKISFPLLHAITKHHALWQEGVFMMQEEVAQKIVATSGRSMGWQSLYFQHYFAWELLDTVPPTAFIPPPQVTSRLIHWRPIRDTNKIPLEDRFWKFVRLCFSQPRRTLKNNLRSLYPHIFAGPTMWDMLRAQQMHFEQFVTLWHEIQSSRSDEPEPDLNRSDIP